jgi:LysR family transcriptional regulator, nitrogen assimilation regulatory protein
VKRVSGAFIRSASSHHWTVNSVLAARQPIVSLFQIFYLGGELGIAARGGRVKPRPSNHSGGATNRFLDSRWGIFLKVAELGSLTRAAAMLNIPQSNISRQIVALERELGVRLFERTGRGVTLSEVGRRLLPGLGSLVRQAETLGDQLLTAGKTPIGEVRIGLLPWIATILAEDLFRAAGKSFPQVKLHFWEGTSGQLRELVDEGRVDMATLLHEHEAPASSSVLLRMTLHLVGPRDSPLIEKPTVSFKSLEGLPLIVPSANHALRSRLAQLEKLHQVTLNYAVEANSMRLQHAIAAAGGGFALTSGFDRVLPFPTLGSSKIVKPELPRSIVLETTLRRPNTLACREVERLIRARAPKLFSGQSINPP